MTMTPTEYIIIKKESQNINKNAEHESDKFKIITTVHTSRSSEKY